ncbi:MAG: SRPBCC family protein [Gordonia sp. (in: high G+C Gram-positive bacteria)]|uniref:SRPBCC family protein n=1 Tax=Gordonia sp. (in: high G+C Gram-positive bacteria) TaxID=84139 RepID=UPI0039E60AD2
MSVSAHTEFDIDAPAAVVMEVLMDVDALPDWSGPHKSAKILSTHDDGTPDRCEITVSLAGITDTQVLDYTWTEHTCSWDLVESGQLSKQHGKYTLTATSDTTTHVRFDLEVDLKIKLPGLLVKQGQKAAVETAKKGLTAEAVRRAAE